MVYFLCQKRGDTMDKIVLASNNQHKIKEFRDIYKEYIILSLNDVGFDKEIEETGATFLENALIKARTVSRYLKDKKLNYPVIADDSGLEVRSLGGEPGVYSARYASDHDMKVNRKYLIEKLRDYEDKSANFTCCLVKYFPNDEYIYAYGKTYGHIIDEELGDASFGYDCIFFSDDLNKTFGEATKEEKNAVSHRKKAIEELKKL